VNDIGFISVAIISGFFSLAAISLMQHNFFKREKFKFNIAREKKVDSLKLKKLEKEFQIKHDPKIIEYPQEQPGIMDLLQNLDLDKIKQIAGLVQQDNDTEGIESDPINVLTGFVQDNPDIVNSFLEGVAAKKQDTNQEKIVYE